MYWKEFSGFSTVPSFRHFW